MESQLDQVSLVINLRIVTLIYPLQGHHGWLHWFNYPIPDGGRPNTDVWPDVSSYSPSELFPAPGLKTKSGEQTFLFSSRNAKTVQRYVFKKLHRPRNLHKFIFQKDISIGWQNTV